MITDSELEHYRARQLNVYWNRKPAPGDIMAMMQSSNILSDEGEIILTAERGSTLMVIEPTVLSLTRPSGSTFTVIKIMYKGTVGYAQYYLMAFINEPG